MWIAGTERSRKIDQLADSEFGLPSRVLMERAGLAVFEAVRQMLPDGGRTAIVCGRGKNGGDGFVTARLAIQNGYEVTCLVAGCPDSLCPETEEQMNLATAAGISPIFSCESKFNCKLDCLSRADLIIDALLGTGASREVSGPILAAINAINRSGVPVIAVDVPSGINADNGEELGASVWALKTICLGLPKPFLFEGTGLEHAGLWSVADLGLPKELLRTPTDAKMLSSCWVSDVLPERLKHCHKMESGSLLIVAGSTLMPGAALMAAKSAMRAGAGLVTVASVRSVCDLVVSQLPECIVCPLPEKDGAIDAGAEELILEASARTKAAVFGPGLTHRESVLEALRKTWRQWRQPCVIDADALNAVAMGVAPPESDFVMTPHTGEMGRLMKLSCGEIQADRFKTVRAAGEKYGGVVLLKGPHTLIAKPGSPVCVNSTGNSGMASAGMGDVLSGVIGALLSQEVPAMCAASAGVYWHGDAGDLCAEQIGPIGYTASDLTERLPAARRRITAC